MSPGSAIVELAITGAAFLAGMGVLERSERPPHAASTRVPEAVRWAVVLSLFVTSLVHAVMVPDHLAEAPYMGELFVAFSMASFALAALVAARPSPSAYLAAAVLCAAAVAGYAATRLVAFPRLADDVGQWFEPLGVVSVLAEAAVVGLGLAASKREQPPR